MGILASPVVSGMAATQRAVPRPSKPASMTVVRLNFEVFADLYQYSAYDSTAFVGFVSSLSNVTLGLSNNDAAEIFANSVSGMSCTRQAENGVRRTCVLQEIQTSDPAIPDRTQQQKDMVVPDALVIPRGATEDVRGEEHEAEEADLEVLAAKPASFPRRRHKKQVPLDTSLLRRSARPSSASISASGDTPTTPSVKTKDKGKAPLRVDNPLDEGHTVPAAPPAPYLSLGNVQVIGSGFCKVPPSAVSRDVLLSSDDGSKLELPADSLSIFCYVVWFIPRIICVATS
jgi:hypothetical protein